MTDMLDKTVAPWERMAEIRRLVREAATEKALLEKASNVCSRMTDNIDSSDWTEEMWAADLICIEHIEAMMAMQDELLEHLSRAEALGELGECEGMLSVSYAGRA